MKKSLRYAFYILLGLIIALALLPILFTDEFESAFKSEINKKINAELDFESSDISLFTAFPRINVSLKELTIVGQGDFKDDTLLYSKSFKFTTNWKSLLRSNQGIEVLNLEFIHPSLNVIYLSDGQANYLIQKEGQSSRDIFGNISRYAIEQGDIKYQDKLSDYELKIENISHTGSGDFFNNRFNLETKTDIESISVLSEGMPLISEIPLSGDMNVLIDLDKNSYTIAENELHLRDLEFNLIGELINQKSGFDLDFKIQSPSNQIASFINLNPSLLADKIENYIIDGQSTFQGAVVGHLDRSKNIFPKLDLLFGVQNASISKVDLEHRLSNINFKTEIKSSKNDLSDLTIVTPSFVFETMGEKIMGRFNIESILSDPAYDMQINGNLNLEEFSEFIQLSSYEDVKGHLIIDAEFEATQSEIENRDYNSIDMKGQLQAEGIAIKSKEYGDLSVDFISTKLASKAIDIELKNINFNNSDFSGHVLIEDPLLFLADSNIPHIGIKGTSTRLVLPEGKESDENRSTTSLPKNAEIDLKIEELIANDQSIQDIAFNAAYSNQNLTISNLEFKINETTGRVNGIIKHPIDYYLNGKVLGGQINLYADQINLDQHTNRQGESQSAVSNLSILQNLDVSITPSIDLVQFKNYRLTNFNTDILIKEGQANMSNAIANFCDGQIALEAALLPSNTGKAMFDIKYAMDDIDFVKMISSSKSFKLLAPVAEYLDGVFNSTLVLSGPLNENFELDLYKINASGFLETVQGQIKGFKPLEVLGAGLGLEQLKSLVIKDSKNWFDIENGIINVKERDFNIDDMQFKVAGSHGLNQDIDYIIKAVIPRQ